MKKHIIRTLLFSSIVIATLTLTKPATVLAHFNFPELAEDGYFYEDEVTVANGLYSNKYGTYYFVDGKRGSGWIDIDNITHFFRSDYKMAQGWTEIDGIPYYFYKNPEQLGEVRTGWVTYNGDKYYFDPETKRALTGWQTVDGYEYYFCEEAVGEHTRGALLTGWVTKDDLKFYYDPITLQKATGWQNIYGIDFYFWETTTEGSDTKIQGNLARSCKVDGKKLNSDGVTDSTKYKMFKKAFSLESKTEYLILVDTKKCRVGIFQGSANNWEMIKYWKCSPGAASTPTVTGTFKIEGRRTYFISGNSWCHWATGFYGNYMFHSTLYNSNGTNQDSRLGMNLSHGCVRLQIKNAKWIYDNIPRGTKVVVYKK